MVRCLLTKSCLSFLAFQMHRLLKPIHLSQQNSLHLYALHSRTVLSQNGCHRLLERSDHYFAVQAILIPLNECIHYTTMIPPFHLCYVLIIRSTSRSAWPRLVLHVLETMLQSPSLYHYYRFLASPKNKLRCILSTAYTPFLIYICNLLDLRITTKYYV